MQHSKVKQTLYKPKKEKIELLKAEPAVTGQQVIDYIGNMLWDQRVFIVVTILILENVYLLVR